MTDSGNDEATADDSELADALWNLDFSVCKSIRYHAYRRAFFDSCDRWTKALSAVSGAGALVAFTGYSDSVLAKVFAFLVAILASADLVVGFGTSSRKHEDLYRVFSMLARDMAAAENPTRSDLTKWRARRAEIEMDEPTILDWLERRASADECLARGCEVRSAWKLKRWQIALSQWALFPQWFFGDGA